MMKKKSRIEWIDNAKFFCIVLIVLGHVGMPDPMTRFFSAFRVPLFFFLSGFLFSYDGLKAKAFLIKKGRSLVLPYLIFSVVTYSVWWLFAGVYGIGTYEGITPVTPLIGIFYSVGDGGFLAHDAPLWFITCLFMVEALYYFIFARLEGPMRYLALAICSVLGFVCPFLLPVRLPWSADAAFTGVVFYAAGRWIQSGKADRLLKSSWAAAVMFYITLGASWINGRVDLNHLIQGNYFLYYIAAFSGIFCAVHIAQRVKANRFSRFFGRHTAPIMAFHLAGINLIHFLRNNSMGSIHVTGGAPFLLSCLDTVLIFFLMIPCIHWWDRLYRGVLAAIDGTLPQRTPRQEQQYI